MNTLFTGDCKFVLKKMMKEGVKVDLIYLDPPFNSNADYNTIMQGAAQQKAFNDTWHSDELAINDLVKHYKQLLNDDLKLNNFTRTMLLSITNLQYGTSENRALLSYLIYMTERLLLMKQVLKESSSIYYHCDPTASHYVKVIMDAIFGLENFENEIIWKRTTSGVKGSQFKAKKYGSNHDVILFYTQGNHYYLDITQNLVDDENSDEIKKKFPLVDDNGRYYNTSTPLFRAPSMGPRPNLCYQWRGFKNPNLSGWRLSKERLEEEYTKGNVVISKDGTKIERRAYQYDYKGFPLPDLWADINNARGKEHLGYPTQKPLALLNRIIKASCPPNGVVFDPFCGCGTTIAAAHNNGVAWLGSDISIKATNLIKKRLGDIGVGLSGFTTTVVKPQTLEEYELLSAFEKQDFLVRACGGLPNVKKSGDRGIDGDLKIYMGIDVNGHDIEGRVIYSVKTGKQKGPALVRELIGTVEGNRASIGILLLDQEATTEMLLAAKNAGQIEYKFDEGAMPQHFDKINMVTAQQLIKLDIDVKNLTPPDFYYVKMFKDGQKFLGL
jgi:site-specific DNA-methyltransferase (adenine-specific)